jgi:hydroxymethylpyrimidine/phosphomethylpyrimidine kinase
VYGMGAITLLTVQNSHGVRRVEPVAPQLLTDQLDALFEDIVPGAIKTGALASAAHVSAVAARLWRLQVPLVVDPVMSSKSGAALLDADGCKALREQLLPLATLLTPNLDEAELLLGRPVRDASQIVDAARALRRLGPRAVLLKGGHRAGDPIDVLCTADEVYELRTQRVVTRHTHGVGCTLSAAIAARLALGHELFEACALAKRWLVRALASAPGVGGGQGSVNHLAPLPHAQDSDWDRVTVQRLPPS